jgi:hypothetical protein
VYQGEKTGRDLMFRAEYQTLRKLAKSGAIVFSIRTYQMYLEDFKTYPRNEAECLIKAIETTHPDVISYKAMPYWKDASLKYLRENVLYLGRSGTKWKDIALFFCGSIAVLVVALLVGWKYSQLVKAEEI